MNKPAIEWLLEDSQPSMRYLSLIHLLDRPAEDPEVVAARNAICEGGWVKYILGLQSSEGHWGSGHGLYQPKYVSTNWMLLILSDLGLTKEDSVIDSACMNWIELFGAQDGGFVASARGGAKRGHLCTTGNTARALVKFGYADLPRVRSAFDWFVKSQAEKGGWSCFDVGMPPRGRNLDSWEPLSAFAVYPRQKWNRSMKAAVEKGAEFFLERELHKQGERYEPWYRFHYPVHYYYDLLVGLDFMTALGYTDDRRLDYAISLLKEKRRKDGRWNLDAIHPEPESPQGLYNKKNPRRATVQFSLEEAGKPSKMITLTALRVLKRIEEAG